MDACATFEHKWANAFPEFGLALRFVPDASRRARSALACIGFEIEHVALRIGEAQVAAGKLQWWLDELLSMRSGTPRHPLTEVVAKADAHGAVSAHDWQQFAIEALCQRDAGPAASLDALCIACRPLHLAQARIECALFGEGDAEVRADALVLSRLLRDAIALEPALARGQLPLPLDLLARHRLARTDFAGDGISRDGALRGHFAELAGRMRRLDSQSLSVIAATALHAERVRSERLARAPRPLAVAGDAIARLPPSTVWVAWRSARRHRMHARAGSRYP